MKRVVFAVLSMVAVACVSGCHHPSHHRGHRGQEPYEVRQGRPSKHHSDVRKASPKHAPAPKPAAKRAPAKPAPKPPRK